MLPWWIIFVVIALTAAAFGIVGLPSGAAGTAQVCLFTFIGVAVLMIVAKILGRRRTSRIPRTRQVVKEPELISGTRLRPGSGPR